jgi:hypothetical protein
LHGVDDAVRAEDAEEGVHVERERARGRSASTARLLLRLGAVAGVLGGVALALSWGPLRDDLCWVRWYQPAVRSGALSLRPYEPGPDGPSPGTLTRLARDSGLLKGAPPFQVVRGGALSSGSSDATRGVAFYRFTRRLQEGGHTEAAATVAGFAVVPVGALAGAVSLSGGLLLALVGLGTRRRVR